MLDLAVTLEDGTTTLVGEAVVEIDRDQQSRFEQVRTLPISASHRMQRESHGET